MRIKAHGKFLFTAEYLVLEGARAFAAPLQFGQELEIEARREKDNLLIWKSIVQNDIWFEAVLEKDDFMVVETNDKSIATTLGKLLGEARKINPDFLKGEENISASITADFNLSWGLGSSSTLVSCIARWAEIDAYQLLDRSFGGSGYDIACAESDSPLFYQRTNSGISVQSSAWNPRFKTDLFFVYLGEKMNSRTGMSYFRQQAKYSGKDIQEISSISERWVNAASVEELEELIDAHESHMGTILNLPPVRQQRFPDYPYSVKSLGAWGGDFVLVTGRDSAEVFAYFHSKGMETIFRFDEIIRSGM